VPGQIGLLQATEAIKLILNKGKPLIGRILLYHSLETEFKVFTVKKNPLCPLCGEKPKITYIMDQQEVCSLSQWGVN
jgi:adenylyltransferase/sulfurtransferase